MLDLAARAVLAAFDRLTGLHLLSDVQGFVRSFDGMYAGFADRAAQAQALIRDRQTLVVLVTTAEAERIEQAGEFIDALAAMGITLGAVAVNRMTAPLPAASTIASADLPAALKRKLIRNLEDFGALARRENRGARSITREATGGRAPDGRAGPRA